MVLHDGGRRRARRWPLLQEARAAARRTVRCRRTNWSATPTACIGVVAAALGRHGRRPRRRCAARSTLTPAGYGPAHSHTLRAELSQARAAGARRATPRALQRLADDRHAPARGDLRTAQGQLAGARLRRRNALRQRAEALSAHAELDAIDSRRCRRPCPRAAPCMREVAHRSATRCVLTRRSPHQSNGGCCGSGTPSTVLSPRMTFLNSARDTDT